MKLQRYLPIAPRHDGPIPSGHAPVARHNPVRVVIVDLLVAAGHRPGVMLQIIWLVVRALVSGFRSRRDLVVENLALRQQLAAFKARGK